MNPVYILTTNYNIENVKVEKDSVDLGMFDKLILDNIISWQDSICAWAKYRSRSRGR